MKISTMQCCTTCRKPPSMSSRTEGGIKLLCVKDGKVYIELTGTCHGYSMCFMMTKMVVQKELRALIHPELEVINVDGTPKNQPPEDCYRPQEEKEEEGDTSEKKSEGVLSKVKKALSL